MEGNPLMKIAVCCSSSNDIDEKYLESSQILLKHIFKQNNDLVFGATNSGIMGIAIYSPYNLDLQYVKNVI